MKNRTTKKLLLLLKEELVKDRCAGLCGLLRGLQFTEVITTSEKHTLMLCIEEYKPNIKVFYTMDLNDGILKTECSNGTYLWKPYDDSARLKWLDAMIKKETHKS